MRNAWLLVLIGCSSPASDQAPPPPYVPAASRAVMKVHRAAPTREPIAPWSLTASDGSGLELEAIDAKAVIEGPLAFTELHLRFRNPEDRIREGTFAITLPARAAVSRFAMVEDGHLKEAEVVAKALARRAYDDALHRGIDPAILEKGAGNQFTARVFPIPANSTKELVISYSQELTGAGYVLPLTGFPKIDEVMVSLDVAGRPHQELHEKHWQPDHDFFADVETTTGIASGGLIAAAFELQPNDATSADPPTALSVLVDTSASRAPGFAHYVARVRTLVNALAVQYAGLTVDVVAFDQEAKVVYTGPAQDFGDPQIAALVERRADGASDLGQALARVHRAARVAVITDGVVTAGLDNAALAAAFRKLELARVDVILAGGIRDDQVAKTLTRVGARAGDVFDLDDELAPITSGLGEVVRIDVPVEIAGASWFSPHVIPSVRAGTQVMVYAQVAAPQSQLVATLGGAPRTVAVRQGTPAFVERATARVEIDELETQLAAATIEATKAKLRKQIETRSIASRVVSSQATMLVLDNDAEYARYGIDRNALVDILVVGPRGLEQQHRTFLASKDHPHGHGKLTREEALEAARMQGTLGGGGDGGGTIGVGHYGTIGHGSGTGQGYGVGGGQGGLRGRTTSVPSVRIAVPMVQGS
ncbi:MAG: VIT domain-containing protein, partial [Kofleriaceae bacterium]